ncbi:hypothetical protein BJ138DRAFT_1157816 [Hygrophoropsis aurantiaca]|uniref:Uncharacterized protein n=1 Tax=Hygrophoropsis aurantiaca TaxID=72124 RepID=A0ACB8A5K7_9AGAM|nr:hypothetical protein BJ138DRAFT_1157816 [Hygrophoropsis aurantiaca]
MGTYGTKVFRYKGVYFKLYDKGAYPEDMGLEMLHLARSGDFKALYEELDKLLADKTSSSDFRLGIARGRPLMSTSCSEYMYEIDFDRGVFHFQGQPFYRLDNLPSDEEFLNGLGEDNFENPCPRQECPREHIYEWKAAPPVIDLAALRARIPDVSGTEMALHDILGVSIHLSDGEATRERLIEVVIARYIGDNDISALVREFESFAGADQILKYAWKMAFSMVNLPFMVQIFPQPYNEHHKRMEFIWVRRDIVVHVTTHLDDATALQAAILRIVEVCVKDEENEEKRPDVLFGVAFSVNHCAVVRVSKKNESEISFQHTPALQFVPSFFADSPSTPGITALARLASRPDPDMMQRALWSNFARATFMCISPMTHRLRDGYTQLHKKFNLEYYRSDWKSNAEQIQDQDSISTVARTAPLYRSAAERLPLEIWTHIAALIESISSLINLGCVSCTCEQAVCAILQRPHIIMRGNGDTQDLGLYRLTKAVPYQSGCFLRYAEFEGVVEGEHVQITMGYYESELSFVYPLYHGEDALFKEHQNMGFSVMEMK